MTALADDDARAAFEKWISAPPFERDVDRWPDDETLHSWPGTYKAIGVEIAWESYRAGIVQGMRRAEEIVDRWHDQTAMDIADAICDEALKLEGQQ